MRYLCNLLVFLVPFQYIPPAAALHPKADRTTALTTGDVSAFKRRRSVELCLWLLQGKDLGFQGFRVQGSGFQGVWNLGGLRGSGSRISEFGGCLGACKLLVASGSSSLRRITGRGGEHCHGYEEDSGDSLCSTEDSRVLALSLTNTVSSLRNVAFGHVNPLTHTRLDSRLTGLWLARNAGKDPYSSPYI